MHSLNAGQLKWLGRKDVSDHADPSSLPENFKYALVESQNTWYASKRDLWANLHQSKSRGETSNSRMSTFSLSCTHFFFSLVDFRA